MLSAGTMPKRTIDREMVFSYFRRVPVTANWPRLPSPARLQKGRPSLDGAPHPRGNTLAAPCPPPSKGGWRGHFLAPRHADRSADSQRYAGHAQDRPAQVVGHHKSWATQIDLRNHMARPLLTSSATFFAWRTAARPPVVLVSRSNVASPSSLTGVSAWSM